MAKVRSLTDSTVNQNKRQVRTYGTKTDLASTVVERGSTHWAEGSNVNIDGFLGVAGTQRVTGLLDVTGTFNGSGTNNMDGTNNLSGDNNFSGQNDFTGPTTMSGTFEQNGESTFNGPSHFNGSVDITETLDVTAETRLRGATTVEADLEITAGGIFKAGVTKIEPNGKATFGDFVIDPSSNKLIEAPGGWLFTSGPDSLGLASSLTSSMNLNSEYAELNYPGATIRARNAGIDLMAPTVIAGTGSNKLTVTPTSATLGGVSTYVRASDGVGIRLFGLPTTTNKANLYASTDGWVCRSTA